MRVSLRIALRELRGGLHGLRIFLGCLVIGVTMIACVDALSTRIQDGIRAEAKTLLGGDAELTLTNARATPEQLRFLQSYGKISLSVSLRAMAIAGDNAALVEVKGIDASYPLLGEVTLRSHRPLGQALGDGIAVEPALLDRLAAGQGTTITVGNAALRIADIIDKEPDRIAGALTLGPHLLIALSDLERTGLLLPGSLVRYQYHLLLRDPQQLRPFLAALKQVFPAAAWTVKSYTDNNRTVQGLIEKLQLFLTLAGLSSLLIGGVGILSATEAYIGRKFETIATLKAIGGRRRTLFAAYALVLLAVSLAGIALASVAGLGLAAIAIPYLAQFFPLSTETAFDCRALWRAAVFGLLTVFTFATPALGRGVEVRPTLLFRGGDAGAGGLSRQARFVTGMLALLLIAFILFSASDRLIAAGFIGLALLCFLVFSLAASLLRRAAGKVRSRRAWLKLALVNLHRPGLGITSMMLSVGMALAVLVALAEVRANVQKDMDETLPALAPSLFVIDIQPYQRDALFAYLHQVPYVSDVASAPMVRGRIAKLKGVPVEEAPIGAEAKWATESDRGISAAIAMPPRTRLTAGKWWPADYQGKPLVSLDAKLASGMGLTVGDTITLNILGEERTAQIANLRVVNYASFQINFALIVTPGAIDRFPATTIATLRVDNAAHETLLTRELASRFPNISSIPIRDSLAQLREIVGHMTLALHLATVTALVTGILVLAGALTAGLDKRAYDIVVLRVLGARRADILKAFFAEELILALATTLIAGLFGIGGAWLILQRLDWLEFQFLPLALAPSVLATLACVVVTGLAVHARIFRRKAASILRNE